MDRDTISEVLHFIDGERVADSNTLAQSAQLDRIEGLIQNLETQVS